MRRLLGLALLLALLPAGLARSSRLSFNAYSVRNALQIWTPHPLGACLEHVHDQAVVMACWPTAAYCCPPLPPCRSTLSSRPSCSVMCRPPGRG